MPAATTVKVAVCPLLIVIGSGWLVMEGGTLTVTVAALEFAVPSELLARTQ